MENTSFVKAEKNQNACVISVPNRNYTIGSNGALFSSITVNDNEILAKPITVNIFSKGKKCVFNQSHNYIMSDGAETEKTVISTFESNTTVVNVSHRVEFDGCDDITVSVMPRGRSVAQVFGLEELKTDAFDVDKLNIEFPIKKSVAKFYHTFPFGGLLGNTQELSNTSLDYAGAIPSGGFRCAFKEQVFLGGEKCGLGVFFEDNKFWKNADKTKAVEIIEEDDCFVIRLNILDSCADIWSDKGKNNMQAIDLMPLRIKFGMLVTPVKPYPKREFYQRSLHLDCFKKILCDYDEFLSGKKNADGSVNKNELSENGFDRLKRLGVEVLYIHEKWNDIQNSPFLTEDTSRRIKFIISECHKRNIKVIPYFGYEISTLSPVWSKYGDEVVREAGKFSFGYWYRFPYQRDLPVCMKSRWNDILYDGITKLYDEYGFDGLYFDTLAAPKECCNRRHGCGYLDSDGNVNMTYPVWEIRSFMKKMYAFVKSRNGTMNVHSYGAFNLAALYFCDSLWEGETFQSLLLRGELSKMPETLLRAQFTGVDTGIPVYSLCYSNDPVWTFKNASSIALLHGSVPKPIDIGEPLETMSKIWNALDNFPLEESVWKPYYEATDKITANDSEIKITAWESTDKILAVCASTYSSYKKDVKITCAYENIQNALTGETISENGEFVQTFCGFDYVLIVCNKLKQPRSKGLQE